MLVVLQQKSRRGDKKLPHDFQKWNKTRLNTTSWFSYPWHPCMVCVTCIYHTFKPDVIDKYTIHGCYGNRKFVFFLQWSLCDYVAFVLQRWDSNLGCELFISWICRTFFRCLAGDLQKWSKGFRCGISWTNITHTIHATGIFTYI